MDIKNKPIFHNTLMTMTCQALTITSQALIMRHLPNYEMWLYCTECTLVLYSGKSWLCTVTTLWTVWTVESWLCMLTTMWTLEFEQVTNAIPNFQGFKATSSKLLQNSQVTATGKNHPYIPERTSIHSNCATTS